MMARIGIVGLCLGMMASISALAAPDSKGRSVKQYTIEQFLDTESVGGSSFAPDERSLVYSSNKSGIWNVYAVPAAGGPAKPLTSSTKDSTFSVGYFPKDGRLLYTHDQGGNENNHLYVRELDGTERDLTPGDKLKASFLRWKRDDTGFYHLTNARDPKYFDLFRTDAASLQSTLLYEDKTGYQVADLSADERYLALVKPNTTSDSDIYLYDTSTKQIKHLTPHEGDVSFTAQQFDPQGKNLYFTTDEGSEFAYLARYELATGKRFEVERAPWDIGSCSFSKTGKYRVVTINEDASTRIKIYDTASNQLVPLPALPGGEIRGVNISPSERRMAFYLNGDASPSNLYLYDFASREYKRLTDTLSKQIDAKDLVEAQVIRYKSFDGMPIPALLYKPQQAAGDTKLPAIVEVHGGPGGQSRHGYWGFAQYLVNHGYVVLRVNNRGSSGYGKTFFTADDQKHGREPLWDCVQAKKYLQSLSYVDQEQIGILGGSYGGYMTLAALAFQPKEFRVGVDLFGVANWVRTLESIPPYWESFRKALYKELGDPKTQRDMLTNISPLFHAEKIERPLLVLQGANDPRVIKPESDDMVAAIKKKGGVVEYIVFDDEGHGFTKKKNEVQGYGAVLAFLDKYLRAN